MKEGLHRTAEDNVELTLPLEHIKMVVLSAIPRNSQQTETAPRETSNRAGSWVDC